MRALFLAVLAVLLLIPAVAVAQGQGPPPLPPAVTTPTPAERDWQAQHTPDLARHQAIIAARIARVQQEHPDYRPGDPREALKPPSDAIPDSLRNQRPPHAPPANPRPPDPPRRSEEPTDRILRLLSLGNAPEGQTTGGVQCGAGTQSQAGSLWTFQWVRGYMFCHAPDSFFTQQSQYLQHTSYRCLPDHCYEAAGETLDNCGRWAYDWQGWYCPYDPGYLYDALECPIWSRVLNYVWGYSPGGSAQYNYTVSTPWRQGCQPA